MNIRTCAALLLAAGLPTAVMAVDYPEVEPNETKAQALTNGARVLAAGDSVSGTTTGTSTTTAGASSADTFLIKTTPAALGIYRHRLTISTGGTAGHAGSIRGLTGTGTGAVATSDATIQSSGASATGTTPGRTNQWYGFGKEEQLYYRVTGTGSTTGTYVATLATDVITPTAFPTNPESGPLTISHNSSAISDSDIFLFDSNFNPIAGIDDPDTQALAATLPAGTYYIAYGRSNVAAGNAVGSSIIQGSYQSGAVLDFANAVTAASSSTTTSTIGCTITAANGAHTASGVALTGAFDVSWFTFTVVPSVTPTNPTVTASLAPSLVSNDGTVPVTVRATVTPGANPTSTFVGTGSVTATSTAFVSSITLLDNGVAPDTVAGDNIFAGSAMVLAGSTVGTYAVTVNATDDQSRSATPASASLRLVGPGAPGCPSGASTLTFFGPQGDGSVGDVVNGVVTGDFGLASQINTIRISGRMYSNAIFNSEARIRATAPDGTNYDITPFPTGSGTNASPRDLINFNYVLTTPEAGTGTWTFRFYESINDSAAPDVIWERICFAGDLVQTPITATDTATGPVFRDGVATSTLSVTVTPGTFPDSSGLRVVVDATSVGGSSELELFDDGNAPDLVAGDNIYTGSTTVAFTTSLGTATLPYTVSDDQSRSFADALNFTVSEATGACCTTSGCVVATIGDCLTTLEGTFAGTGTACIAPTALSTSGAGAFEDISATGTPVSFTDVDDGVTSITLPFTFNFFGTDYTSGNVSTNGNFQFGTNNSTAFTNSAIPSTGIPNNALYVMWDDHDLDAGSPQVHTALLGTTGVDARFIIQWTNAGQYTTTTSTNPSTYQIALFEDGSFEFRYLNVGLENVSGDTTTIGYENAAGTIAFQSALTRANLNALAPVSYRANSTLNDTGVCPPLITDCNDNGIDDADDILNGTSQDCNTNSIPDECDILNGTSLDANENGVPDECDPVSPCAACPADYNQDGGVDGGDLSAFFADYEAGNLECADTNFDGGIDGGDLATFFAAYEAGGC